MTREEAICLLLAEPDPPELHRGFVYTLGPHPERNPDQIKRELGTAYVERRRHEYGIDISEVISVRTHSRLQIVKRA